KDMREIEYFHIKLERHSVIYAEGAACETLRAVTAVNSDSLEFEEYRKLYGEPSLPDEPAAPVLGYNGEGGGGCEGAFAASSRMWSTFAVSLRLCATI